MGPAAPAAESERRVLWDLEEAEEGRDMTPPPNRGKWSDQRVADVPGGPSCQMSSRLVQASWKEFCKTQQTTRSLAREFVQTGVTGLTPEQLQRVGVPLIKTAPEQREGGAHQKDASVAVIGQMSSGTSPRHREFEDAVRQLQSAKVLRAAMNLLARFEKRLEIRGVSGKGSKALLERAQPRSKASTNKPDFRMARIFLCAYMIQRYPETVMNGSGDIEDALSAAAKVMITKFEALMLQVLDAMPLSPVQPAMLTDANGGAANANFSPISKGLSRYWSEQGQKNDTHHTRSRDQQQDKGSMAALLVSFHDAWLNYLDQFVVWKSQDAVALVADLITMAVKLDESMLRKVGLDSQRVEVNADLRAMTAQVRHDHQLLRDRILKLAGPAGIEQLEVAIRDIRASVLAELREASQAGGEATRDTQADSAAVNTTARPLAEAAVGEVVQQALRGAGGSMMVSAHGNVEGADPVKTDQSSEPAEQHSAGDGLTNEQLVWEILYNPEYQLPVAAAEATWEQAVHGAVDLDEQASADDNATPEQQLALLQQKAKGIAEQAFWDSVEWRIRTGLRENTLAWHLAPLLQEMGTGVASLLQDPEKAKDMREQYSEDSLKERLVVNPEGQGQMGGMSLTALLGLLQFIATQLLGLVQPRYAEEVRGAIQQTTEELKSAVSQNDTESLPRHLCKAMRLMYLQCKLIKMQAANLRLRGIARAMQGGAAPAYLRSKFATKYSVSANDAEVQGEQLVSVLPRTAELLRSARLGAVGVSQALLSAGIAVRPSGARAQLFPAEHAPALPAKMATGRNPKGAGLPSSSGADAYRASPPLSLESWQGCVRLALLQLAGAATPAAGAELPELLLYDKERLHAIQNRFQLLLVLASSLITLQQMRQKRRLNWNAEIANNAVARLKGLLNDPTMKLPSLITEICRLAEDDAFSLEQDVMLSVQSMLNPEGAPFQTIKDILSRVVIACMLHKHAVPGTEVHQAIKALLSRAGASAILDEVKQLASDIDRVASVNSSVYSNVWAKLYESTQVS